MGVNVEFLDTSDVVWKDTTDVHWKLFPLGIDVHDCGELEDKMGG